MCSRGACVLTPERMDGTAFASICGNRWIHTAIELCFFSSTAMDERVVKPEVLLATGVAACGACDCGWSEDGVP